MAWTDVFREAHRQTGMSKSTFRDYFRKLPTILEDGRYRRDPQISKEDDDLGLQELRGQVSDPWTKPSEDLRKIDALFKVALFRYVSTVNRLLTMRDKDQARELFELHMNLRIESALREGAAIAWRNRRKIGKGLRLQPEWLPWSIV
jgi:hypothetical protein